MKKEDVNEGRGEEGEMQDKRGKEPNEFVKGAGQLK